MKHIENSIVINKYSQEKTIDPKITNFLFLFKTPTSSTGFQTHIL